MRGGLREWMVIGLAYASLAAPLMCWSWLSGNRRWLALALILGFALALGLRYADHAAFNAISDAIHETAEEAGAQEVFATPHFIWVFAPSDYDYVTMPYQSPDTPPLTNAVVPLFDYLYVRSWLARAPESCVIEEKRRVPISGFVSNRLRGESDHWSISTISCPKPTGAE